MAAIPEKGDKEGEAVSHLWLKLQMPFVLPSHEIETEIRITFFKNEGP